ncbi:MAG: pyridoxal kinase [Dongiaceae bacterium]
MNILSIQSQVVYGHVGNSAAQFILQRLGHDVWSVPTVLFSNHVGRPSWTGRTLPPEDVSALIDGLAALGALERVDAVMTGYLGDPGNVATVAALIDRLRGHRPQLTYACDPVMGDDGELYVNPALAEAIGAELVGRADILLPNQFELSRLSGLDIGNHATTITAARALKARSGAGIVVATGALEPATPKSIFAIAVGEDGVWRAQGERVEVPASGAGDSFAALFVGHYLKQRDLSRALAAAVTGTSEIFAATAARQNDELVIIGSQHKWANLPAASADRIA